MKDHLTYQPFAGVEFAFSPEIVDRRNERPDLEDREEPIDTSSLRPVRVVERVASFRRGNLTITTTTTIITNRPMNISTTNTGEATQ